MKRMNKKGFTLIELLAVIVILGLLMAIAIPSVTKYITQSRKKTLTNTISNYMAALTTEVNNLSFTFTGADTIYAVPIECIALERGGTDPFGKWFPAQNANWAYVLVQYDDTNSSYTYGFTFKDSAGYGLVPTASHKLDEKGSQVVTGTQLSFANLSVGTVEASAAAGSAKTYSATWSGFNVKDTTKLVVLKSEAGVSNTDHATSGKCLLAQES